jgi:hypothetical protein
VLTRNVFLGLGTAPPVLFADINGDGVADITDYNLVRQRIGTMLPPLTPSVFDFTGESAGDDRDLLGAFVISK